MQEIKVFSEKLDAVVTVEEGVTENKTTFVAEDDNSSLVGWTHKGWNNANGGGSW